MAFEFSFKFGRSEKVSKAYPTEITPTSSNLPRNFIPLSSFQSKNPLDNYIFFYNNIAELNSLITYIGQVAANVKFKHIYEQVNGKQKEVKNSQFIKLLNNPNQNDNGYNLKVNAYSTFYVTGNVFFNSLKPVGFEYPTKLYLLPSNRTYPIAKGAIDQYGNLPANFDKRTSEIVKYNLELNNQFIAIDPSQIIHIKDSSLAYEGKEQLIGSSRISSAVKNIESLSYMNDTINTILGKSGALGFLKKNARNGEQITTLSDTQKKEIEDKFYAYGASNGKMPIMFTDKDLSYVRMLSNVSDFMPIELKKQDFETLCMVIGGFPKVLLEATDSTFANLKEAQKLLYQNIIIPLVNSFAEAFTNSFGLQEGEKIIADWDDIEALMEDEKAENEAQKIEDDLWLNRYNNNLCTLNEMLEELDLKPQPDGNKYKREIDTSTVDENQNGQTGQNSNESNNI